MNRISQALIELAQALTEKERSSEGEEEKAEDPPQYDCTTCETFGIDLDDPANHTAFIDDGFEEHLEWRDELECGDQVARVAVEGYAEDIAQAAILNAATVARIGRKWGFVAD